MYTGTTRSGFGGGATFGSPSNPNPFGANQMFSSNTSFGNPVFGQTASGVFGSQNAQPQNQLFSSGSTTFNPTTQPTFGSTSLFGQQTTPASSTLFMGSNTNMGPMSKPTGFAFPSSQPSLFGQTPQQPAQSSLFQPSTSSSIFGSSAGFGATQSMTGMSGTTIKFTPVTGTDSMQKSGSSTLINTKHHSITCMKEYEAKSFEELRYEDYSANRKGPQSGGFASTGFGATPSLFGQQEAKPTFGATAGFGAPSFGIPSQTPSTGAFGKAPAAFGTTTTTASGFGFPAGQNLFGNTQANKPFGQTTQPLFGNTQQPQAQTFGGGTMFGQQPTSQPNTNTFFKPTQSTFGATQTGAFPVFGQTPAATQSSNLFQTTKPSTGFNLFGQNTTTTASGWSASTGFGTNTVFGKPSQPIFGQQQQQPSAFNTGLSMQNQPSLFGNLGAKPAFGATTSSNLFGTSSTMQPSVGLSMPVQQQPQQLTLHSGAQSEELRTLLSNADPYGYLPCLGKLDSSKTDTHYCTNPKELDTMLTPTNVIKHSFVKEKKVQAVSPNNSKWNIYDNESGDKAQDDSFGFAVKSNPRRLYMKCSWSMDSKKEPGWIIKDGKIVSASATNKPVSKDQLRAMASVSGDDSDRTDFSVPWKPADKETQKSSEDSPKKIEKSRPIDDSPQGTASRPSSYSSPGFHLNAGPSQFDAEDSASVSRKSPAVDTCGVICTRPEYYTLPALDKLQQYKNADGTCFIIGFTIGRHGYGNVYFFDVMNVANLNIDALVHIRYREVCIYLDDENKPPVGEGLNRPAQVTLDQVFPRDRITGEFITDPEKIIQENYSSFLRSYSTHMGVQFVDYRPETGSWVFRVDHFSKYGMQINEEDEFYKFQRSAQDTQTTHGAEQATNVSARGLGGFPDVPSSTPNIRVLSNVTLKSTLPKQLLPPQIDDRSGYPVEVLWERNKNKRSESIEVMKDVFFDQEGPKRTKVQYDDDEMYEPMSTTDVPEQETYFARPIAKTESAQAKGMTYFRLFNSCRVSEECLPSKCNIVDAALLKRRSFKCGWGAGLKLFVPTTQQLSVSVVRVSEYGPDLENRKDPFTESDMQERLLRVVMDASTLTLQTSEEIPFFKMNCAGNDYLLQEMVGVFEHYQTLAKHNEKLNYYTYVWQLMMALWGQLEDPSNTDYCRKESLSAWLRTITQKGVQDRISRLKHEFHLTTQVKKMFIYLTGNQIENALEVASSTGYLQLSLLLSQLNSGLITRHNLKYQLKFWHSLGMLEYINEDLIRLYSMCAGLLAYLNVDIRSGLDWISCLALHFWYISPAEQVLQYSVQTYEEAFMNNDHISKPLSKYGTLQDTCDIFYHILKLYCNNQTILDQLLCPQTHTNDPNDYRLSWLLQQVFTSLGVGLISETSRIKTTSGFAAQLEEYGFYKWAVFVSLHQKDIYVRKNSILSLLDRRLSNYHDDFDFVDCLVNQYKIPVSWIHEVKAYKNKWLSHHWLAYRHFAYTNMWYECHDIVINDLAPQLVCNHNFRVLLTLLDCVEEGKDQILRWKYEGGLLMQFIELWNVMYDKESPIRDSHVMKLKSEVNRLINIVSHYTQRDYKQTMIAAELSKYCFTFYQAIAKQTETDQSYVYKSIKILASMLMPFDYKYRELKNYLSLSATGNV